MRTPSSRLWPLVFCFGCTAVQTAPQAPPAQSGPVPAAEPSGTEVARPTTHALLGAAPTGLASPPAECSSYQRRAPHCEERKDAAEALAAALEQDGVARDRALSCLEADFPPGVVLALRAEFVPRGCADQFLGDASAPNGTASEVEGALVALGTGARLFRSVRQPPLPQAPFTKREFLQHFSDVLRPWVLAQAKAVEQLSSIGPRLPGYAKGIVALEAGLSDLRFVALSRDLELPQEMRNDPEVKEAYAVALEQALEPRVRRGRDAALVGLREFARLGVLADVRLTEARAALSELYAGRRIDALDRLLLPALPPLSTAPSAVLRSAAKLPTFYAERLLPAETSADSRLLRALLERGLPRKFAALRDKATDPLLARAQLALAQAYFWAEPAQHASELGAPAGDPPAELVRAVASVLSRGPRDAVEMMLGSPTLPRGLAEIEALDTLARGTTETAAFAEFDAAYLRGLAPPANDAAFWREQAARYRRAAKRLKDPAARRQALELGAAAADTERALATGQGAP